MSNINCEHCSNWVWCRNPKISLDWQPSNALMHDIGVPPNLPAPGTMICNNEGGSCNAFEKKKQKNVIPNGGISSHSC